MRILLQRVARARVTVGGRVTGEIERGLLLLVGLAATDSESVFPRMIEKVAGLRLFPDAAGRFDRSVAEVGGGILTVSQFTLYADCRKGRRPSFSDAMAPDGARELYAHWVAALRAAYKAGPVADGEFGAMMDVELVNDGPVTVWLDSEELFTAETQRR